MGHFDSFPPPEGNPKEKSSMVHDDNRRFKLALSLPLFFLTALTLPPFFFPTPPPGLLSRGSVRKPLSTLIDPYARVYLVYLFPALQQRFWRSLPRLLFSIDAPEVSSSLRLTSYNLQ